MFIYEVTNFGGQSEKHSARPIHSLAVQIQLTAGSKIGGHQFCSFLREFYNPRADHRAK
jgi:hypothetical protein